MGFLERYVRRDAPTPLAFNDWVSFFSYQNQSYPLFGHQTITGTREEIASNYGGFARVSKSNSVVFALMALRMRLFSEGRFQFCQLSNGRPGKIFGDQSLAILERPWENGTTSDLLARMIQDADLAGNFYAVRLGQSLYRMQPDWTTIILGSPRDPESDGFAVDAEVLGYAYQEGGPARGRPPRIFMPDQVCHFVATADPEARFRGMSWLQPVIREVLGDNAATDHKQKYFEAGATPNMIVSTDLDLDEQQFGDWVDAMRGQNEGLVNAYKTLYLAKGGSAQVVGANLQQIDFKNTQGAGETRMAAAAGIPPVIAGFSEGLQGSSLNAGNFAAARRSVADGTMRPTWRKAAGAMQVVVPPPNPSSELIIDTRDIAWLREDQKDAADTQAVEAQTMHSLISAGFKPNSVVLFMETGDRTVLEHTDLFSVQLRPAGSVSEGKGSSMQGVPEPNSSQSAPANPDTPPAP